MGSSTHNNGVRAASFALLRLGPNLRATRRGFLCRAGLHAMLPVPGRESCAHVHVYVYNCRNKYIVQSYYTREVLADMFA